MQIPSSLRAGDTWSWTESLSEYPATTYTLKYTFWKYGETQKTVTATASGDDHDISVSAAVSVGYAPGQWQWAAYVETGDPVERTTIDDGSVRIKPALFSQANIADYRTHAERVLDAVEAAIEGRATQTQSSLSVNGKAIAYMRHDELLRLRAVYRRQVDREKGKSRVVGVRFGGA